MKIKKLTLQHYKRFGAEAKEISFCDNLGFPNDVSVLLGDNGSGKSSILQAIASVIGSAVRNKMSPSKLDWPGYNFEYLYNGKASPIVKADVLFTEDELAATQEFSKAIAPEREDIVVPSREPEVSISLDFHQDRAKTSTRQSYFQFRGYQYALQLNGGEGTFSENLRRVGSIYWYTEQRTATSAFNLLQFEGKVTTDKNLRTLLLNWTSFHDMRRRPHFIARDGQRDRFEALNKLFQSIFPGKTLLGSVGHPDPERQTEPTPFWLRDENGKEYELSSMSAGERAIFPMLIDFANWEIHNSIILIDEIELHLHPPLQQMLIRALPKLGTNNQFIITSHSDHVVGMFAEDQIIRL